VPPVPGAATKWLWLGAGIAAVRQQTPAGDWYTQSLRFDTAGPYNESAARTWADAHKYGRGLEWTPSNKSPDPRESAGRAARKKNPGGGWAEVEPRERRDQIAAQLPDWKQNDGATAKRLAGLAWARGRDVTPGMVVSAGQALSALVGLGIAEKVTGTRPALYRATRPRPLPGPPRRGDYTPASDNGPEFSQDAGGGQLDPQRAQVDPYADQIAGYRGRYVLTRPSSSTGRLSAYAASWPQVLGTLRDWWWEYRADQHEGGSQVVFWSSADPVAGTWHLHAARRPISEPSHAPDRFATIQRQDKAMDLPAHLQRRTAQAQVTFPTPAPEAENRAWSDALASGQVTAPATSARIVSTPEEWETWKMRRTLERAGQPFPVAPPLELAPAPVDLGGGWLAPGGAALVMDQGPAPAPPRRRSRKAAGETPAPRAPRSRKTPATPRQPRASKRAPVRTLPLDLVGHARRAVEPYPPLRGMLGERGALILPGSQSRGFERLPIRWAVVEADALIPSHQVGKWTPDPRYPATVQERDYSADSAERRKVELQVAVFEPALMNSDSPTAVDGPPVVSPSGFVLGGNSRSMTVQMVYADRRRADQAKSALLSYLAASGIHGDWPRDALVSMAQPVLVRILALSPEEEQDPARLRDLVARLNLTLTQALDPRRAAASAAARLTPAAVARIVAAAPEDKPPSEWLAGPGGVAMLGALREAGVITERNLPTYADSKGKLNDAGRRLALVTLAAAVVDDAEVLDWLAPKELDELAAASGAILAASGYGRDIRPELRRSFVLRKRLKTSGDTLEQLAAQVDLERVEWLPTTPVERLVWEIVTKHKGTRAFPTVWREFAVRAKADSDLGQQGLGLYDKRSTEELLQIAMTRGAKKAAAAGERLENPLRVATWDSATSETGATATGPWTVPDRKAGQAAAAIGQSIGAQVVTLHWRDALGTLIPVARYRVADGHRLGDPRPLRLSNPANPSPYPTRLVDVGDRATYERSVIGAARPEVAPVLSWLLADAKLPTEGQWETARAYVRNLASKGATAYPWGILAVAHADGPDDDPELHLVDAAGYELRLTSKSARWDPRKPIRLLNPAAPPAPAEYFARRLRYAANPWRWWLEACLREGESEQPAQVWESTRAILEGHHAAKLGAWPWGEFAWVERDRGGWSLRDVTGYGLDWDARGRCMLRGVALPTEEGAPITPAELAGAMLRASQAEAREDALRAEVARMRQHAPAAAGGPGPSVEDVNRALLEGSLMLSPSGLPIVPPPPPGSRRRPTPPGL
jgi:hypothetical protein